MFQWLAISPISLPRDARLDVNSIISLRQEAIVFTNQLKIINQNIKPQNIYLYRKTYS